jgi:hypothetical protein
VNRIACQSQERTYDYIPGKACSSADLRFEVGAFLNVSSEAAALVGRSMPLLMRLKN